MMRNLMVLAVASGVMLGGCSAESAGPTGDAQAEEAVRAGFRPDAPAPMATLSTDAVKTPAPGALIPPATERYRFLGRWAANAEACGSSAWTFETTKLSSAAGPNCSFTDVAATIGGYTLTGLCHAERGKVDDVLDITFDAAAKTMRVAGKSVGPTKLLYCGG